ncbi:MAG TPA: nuclear transport factor 2 family protein [Allosphingosinicella sp.]|jgi:hypothetical protein
MKNLFLAAALTLGLCACDPAPRPQSAAAAGEAAIVPEAQAFMAAYARDLVAGDRAAVAARYDRAGAHVLFAGSYRFATHAEIAQRYATQWQPPTAFEWRNLAYEPAGPDAVVVVGQFLWTENGAPPLTFSYSALLRRRDGALRIRVEDEAPNAPPSR